MFDHCLCFSLSFWEEFLLIWRGGKDEASLKTEKWRTASITSMHPQQWRRHERTLYWITIARKLVVLQNPCKPTKECICSHGKLTVSVTLECGQSKLLHITQDGLATNTQWSCWCVFFKVMVLYKVGITSLFAWWYRRFLWNAPVQGGPIWEGVSLVWWDAVFCSFVLYPWAAMIITLGNAMPQVYYLLGKNKLGGALVVYKVCSMMQLLLEHLHQHVPKAPAMGKPICWGLLLWKHDSSGDENSIFTRGFYPKNDKHPLLLAIIEAHKKLQAMEKNLNCTQPQQCFKKRNHKHIKNQSNVWFYFT